MDAKLIADFYHIREGGQRGGIYGLKGALQQAKQADVNSLEKIILDCSEPAWRAYHTAKKATKSTHGFKGQAELSRLFIELSSQPIEQQRTFAQQLAFAMQRDDVESGEAGNGPKRRRTTVDVEPPFPSPNATTTISPTPIIATTIATTDDANHCALAEQNLSSVISQDGVHVNASLTAAKALFPPEFMDSIRRIPNTLSPTNLAADISMFLQEGHVRHHFGCQMVIGISTERVALYAKKLFNVDVEARDGVRYIRYACGIKIEPDPYIKLRGCGRAAIIDVFGAEMDLSFSAAPIYLREALEVRDKGRDWVSIRLLQTDSRDLQRLTQKFWQNVVHKAT